MDKAVIYARVSSKEQEAEGYSIPSQVKLLKEHAAKTKVSIVKEFVDVETAKKAGRTNFNDMLFFIQNNKTIKNIFVEKTDRLLRNLFDLALIDQLITEFGVKVHFVKEGTVLEKESRSTDKFFFGLKALMSKQTVDNLSEEVRKGMKEKAEQGVYPSHAPYGYLNDGTKGRRYIKLDPDAAPYVKKMFELYATGTFSLLKLRKQMLDDGMVYRNGKNFHRSTVELILKNEFYTGVFYWNGVKCENASHPAIVSKELFNQVQGLLMNPNKAKSRKGLFPYTNLISCGLCGCYLTAEIKKEKYIYYRCTGSKGKCSQIYLKQEFLDAEFERLLESIYIPEEAQKLILQGLKENLKDKIEFHDNSVKQIEQQVAVLQKRIDKSYTDKVDGKIDEEFWQQHTARWLADKEQLTMKLLSHQKTDTCFMENANLILELAKKASGLFKTRNAEQKRNLIKLITSNCILKDGKVELELAEPFKQIMKTKESGNWCARQDSNL